MECTKEKNLLSCSCSYEPCSRKGNCCACIAYHRKSNEVPGCLFTPEAEKIYNRSAEFFAQQLNSK